MLRASRMGHNALAVIWGATLLSAQVVTGTISGRVSDSTGAVLPRATLEIRNVETGFSRTLEADAAGRYTARNLPLGSYSVTARLDGFRTEVRSGITLTVGREAIVNLQMAVGTVQESVEVTGEAPMVETTNASLSGLVDSRQLADLPLNGRSYDALALLTPGMNNQPSGARNSIQGGGNRLASNGARADGNAYLLDGTITNDHSSQGGSSAVRQNLGVEAIREFRVLTHNYSAEYGRNAGAVVSVVTRSGTNEFHGSAYEFLRNNVLDARNFFNPGELPPFRRNQFGAALGGPLLRDRVFFFANYEGFRERRGVTRIANVPDGNARKGLLPDANTGELKDVGVSPIIKPYLALWPEPNGQNFGNGVGEFVGNFSSAGTEDYSMERMDFRLSDNDSLYWRYVFDPSEATLPRDNPLFFDGEAGTNHFVTLSETHVFSGTALNEFRFALNRTVPATTTGPLGLDPSLDFFPGQGIGTIVFTSASGQAASAITEAGTRSVAPQIFAQNVYQMTDSFSYVKGSHSLKTGFDLQRIHLNTSYGSRSRGEYRFASLQNLLRASPNRLRFFLQGQVGDVDSQLERGWRRTLFGWFVQDDFRVTPNITLNLGFRHEFMTSPNEVNSRSANLRNPLTDSESTQGVAFETAKANFSPRVGIAWDPTGSGSTSIRGGVGLFYNHLVGRTWYFFSAGDPRYAASIVLGNGVSFPHGQNDGFTLSGTAAADTVEFQPDTPTIMHYNFEVQRQLATTLSIRAGYVGSHGYNLSRATNQNLLIPKTQADGTKLYSGGPRVNPHFSDIGVLLTDANSNYNAFQFELQKALSGGLQLQTSYTFAKSQSNADSISSSQIRDTTPSTLDWTDLGRDYSRSVYDQRHTLVINGRYQMPWDNRLASGVSKAVLGGWAINSIFTYGSGFPFNGQVGFNQSGNGDADIPDRPDLVQGFSNDPTDGVTAGCLGIPAGQKLGTPERWFDPCAFSLPQAGTYGNLGRNTLSGPSFTNVDFSLIKNTALTERFNLEFRAEFFNFFNHPFFATPLRTVFDEGNKPNHVGNAGRIVETNNEGRDIQFGLKLTF